MFLIIVAVLFAISVVLCLALTQSCYVTEGFGMVLLPLLRLLYSS